MLRTNFVFLIKNGASVQSAKLIKTQKTLEKYVKQYPLNEIRTFSSEEEAFKYINLNNYPFDTQKLQVQKKPLEEKATILQNEEILKFIQNEEKAEIQQNEEITKTLQNEEKAKVLQNQEKAKTPQNEENNKNQIVDHQIPQQVMGEENNQIQHNQDQLGQQKPFIDDLYKYYQQNDSLVEKVAKKVIKENMYHLFFDGASKRNPGPSGVGFVIFDQNQKLYESSLNTGFKTNNQAEYISLLYGLKSSLALGIENLNVYGDSLLIINQMNNVFKVKDVKLIAYYNECKKLKKQFKTSKFQQIPRAQNMHADNLANKGVSAFKKQQNEVDNLSQDPENK